MATSRTRLKAGRGIRRPGGASAISRALPWVALGLGLVLVWGAFELGQINAGHSRLAAIQRESALRSELLTSRQEVKSLRERIAVLETGTKVSAEAYRQVKDQLAELIAPAKPQPRFGSAYRMPIIYAGNKDAASMVEETFDESVELSLVRHDGAIRGAFVIATEGDDMVLVNVVCNVSPDTVKALTAKAAQIGLDHGLKQVIEGKLKHLRHHHEHNHAQVSHHNSNAL